jgi:uncharacterized protein
MTGFIVVFDFSPTATLPSAPPMKPPRSGGIPAHVSATRALASGQQFRGALPLSQLPRLAAQVADRDGSLDVELRAEKAAGGAWLRGAIRGELTLTCQRGLHPFGWRCNLRPALRLVTSEAEEQRLLKDAEPYLVQDDRLPLRELVEDEVLLALPMMPRCDDPDCVERLTK